MKKTLSSPVCCWTQTSASCVWERQRNSITNLRHMFDLKKTKAKMTASSLLLFSPLSPLSISLPAHTTLFVTTPLLSSSTLFPCCHGDCKDTEISSLGSTKGLDLEFASFLFILTTQQLCSFLSEVLWNHSIIQRNNKSKTNNGSSRMAPPSVQTGCEDGQKSDILD